MKLQHLKVPTSIRWRHLAISIPVMFLFFLAMTVTMPLLLSVAGLSDLVRRNWTFSRVRCLLMMWVYLSTDTFVVMSSFFLWLARAPMAGYVWLQRFWSNALYQSGKRLLSLHIKIAGAHHIGKGPHILFFRHTSLADTLLASALVEIPHKILVRYTAKRQMLWDPGMNIVGNRLPNAFLYRGKGKTSTDVDTIRTLAQDLGPTDGILIYPEGTRFTPKKLAAAKEQLANHPVQKVRELAQKMMAVLPPRPKGALAILQTLPTADVIFCAHKGLEARSVKDIWRGALVGKTVDIHLWKVSANQIPKDENSQLIWLFEQWLKMDEWVRA